MVSKAQYCPPQAEKLAKINVCLDKTFRTGKREGIHLFDDIKLTYLQCRRKIF